MPALALTALTEIEPGVETETIRGSTAPATGVNVACDNTKRLVFAGAPNESSNSSLKLQLPLEMLLAKIFVVAVCA